MNQLCGNYSRAYRNVGLSLIPKRTTFLVKVEISNPSNHNMRSPTRYGTYCSEQATDSTLKCVIPLTVRKRDRVSCSFRTSCASYEYPNSSPIALTRSFVLWQADPDTFVQFKTQLHGDKALINTTTLFKYWSQRVHHILALVLSLRTVFFGTVKLMTCLTLFDGHRGTFLADRKKRLAVISAIQNLHHILLSGRPTLKTDQKSTTLYWV